MIILGIILFKFYAVNFWLGMILICVIVFVSWNIPTLQIPSGPSIKDVKSFIQKNQILEVRTSTFVQQQDPDPYELKETLDRIKNVLYYNKKTSEELDKEIIDAINSRIQFLESLEKQLQEVKTKEM
ncbi:MAG: hypothetical protein L0L22_14410 [Staphylococcus equorum]|nr:hypothetical protein [Tetragenococcus koreensis]MDN6572177.1 hypothetical protein [Staphylococcus equorum]